MRCRPWGELVAVNLTATMGAIVDALNAGGVRATTDHRDLNPPAVLVTVPVVTPRFGGCYQVDHRLLAVVGNAGDRASIAALDELSAAMDAVLAGLVVQWRPVQMPPLAGGDPLPALEATFSVKG